MSGWVNIEIQGQEAGQLAYFEGTMELMGVPMTPYDDVDAGMRDTYLQGFYLGYQLARGQDGKEDEEDEDLIFVI